MEKRLCSKQTGTRRNEENAQTIFDEILEHRLIMKWPYEIHYVHCEF